MNSKEFEKDWRNRGQKDYLYRKKLRYMNCHDAMILTNRDHEHCEFCWGTISAQPNAINNGYCTRDLSHWVCPDCFGELETLFEWKTIDN